METTTIKLEQGTKRALNIFKEYKNESYDEILKKLVYIATTVKKEPKLSQKTVLEIEAARKRIKAGKFYTEEEVEKIIG